MSRQLIQIGRPLAAGLALASVGAIFYGWDRLWHLMDPDPRPSERGEP